MARVPVHQALGLREAAGGLLRHHALHQDRAQIRAHFRRLAGQRRLVLVDPLQLLAGGPEILRRVLQQRGEHAADAVMAEKRCLARRAHLG